MLLTLAAFVVVIGVLIFVHEAGHFLAAKAVGVQVLRFSLGFGRPLLGWRRGETEYWVAWLPIGGYVKMAGLEDEGMAGDIEGGRSDVPVDPARAFDRQPLWARAVVLVAGVTMNLVLAFLVYTGLAGTVGVSRTNTTQIDTVWASVLPKGAEALGRLRRGDRIVTINGDSVRTWEEIIERLLTQPPPLRVGTGGGGRDAHHPRRVASRGSPSRADSCGRLLLPAPHRDRAAGVAGRSRWSEAGGPRRPG